jgi:aryl carrier-like protein
VNTTGDPGPARTIADLQDLVTLVRDEIGLAVAAEDADRDLDTLPGWDSIHLLTLVTVLERVTGHAITVIDLLEAPTLGGIHALIAAEDAARAGETAARVGETAARVGERAARVGEGER